MRGANTFNADYGADMIRTSHTVGILEDDPLFRDELVRIIANDPGNGCLLAPVFACETVNECKRCFAATLPDLMLVDMNLPDGSGLEIIRQVKAAGKMSLMLTMLGDRASVLSALEEGAQGYLLKDTPSAQIRSAICETLAGHSPISSAAASHLLGLIRRAEPPETNTEKLTERELAILHMISRGLSYAETAQAAGISVHTVGDHIKSIYRKLDVNSKSEAIHEARSLGWLSRFD
jgi:DNA-binding NarL/FixJ family response regulator